MATELKFFKTSRSLENPLFEYLGKSRDGKNMYAASEMPRKPLKEVAGLDAEPLQPRDHGLHSNIDLYMQRRGNSYGRGN